MDQRQAVTNDNSKDDIHEYDSYDYKENQVEDEASIVVV